MSKVLQNKLQKQKALLDSAYELFTTIGFTKTTIRDIAHKAGVAKGTFYLYFNDKVEIRDALVRAKSSQLLQDACSLIILSTMFRRMSTSSDSCPSTCPGDSSQEVIILCSITQTRTRLR